MFKLIFLLTLLITLSRAQAEDGFILKDFDVTKLNVTCTPLGRFESQLEVTLADGQVLDLLNSDSWTFRYFSPQACAKTAQALYVEAIRIARHCQTVDLIARDMPEVATNGYTRLADLILRPSANCVAQSDDSTRVRISRP